MRRRSLLTRFGRLLVDVYLSPRSAYQNNDIRQFEKILKTNRKTIMDDRFVSEYIQDLLKNIRTEVLVKLIQPYTRVRIPFISRALNIPEEDVEELLVSCILDKYGLVHVVPRHLRRHPPATRAASRFRLPTHPPPPHAFVSQHHQRAH